MIGLRQKASKSIVATLTMLNMKHKIKGKEVVSETKSELWSIRSPSDGLLGAFITFCSSCSSLITMLYINVVKFVPKALRLTFGDPSARESIWAINFAFCFLKVLQSEYLA